MKTLYFYGFLLLFTVCASDTAFAQKSKWDFGVTAAYGLGNHIHSWFPNFDPTHDPSDDFEVFQTASFMASVSRQASQRIFLRFNLGLERIFSDEGYKGLLRNHLNLVGEFAVLFHFRKNPGVAFDPYLGIGVGFPNLAHGIIGNKFRFSERCKIFTEVHIIPAIIVNKAEFRVGVLWDF